jgi:hypothetical protein
VTVKTGGGKDRASKKQMQININLDIFGEKN